MGARVPTPVARPARLGAGREQGEPFAAGEAEFAFCDQSIVDFYTRPDLAAMHSRGVLEEALATLERAKIPRPSLAVATGRGLSLVWTHEPVPRSALPRWDACQRRIHDVLKHLGADPQEWSFAGYLTDPSGLR